MAVRSNTSAKLVTQTFDSVKVIVLNEDLMLRSGIIMQDAGVLLRIAYEAMKELDIDVVEVLSRCNISEDVLNDKDLRTPNHAQAHFWQVLEDVTKDPNIGISLSKRMPVFTGQVLQYLFLSSPTFGTGWERATKYFRLISDAASVSIQIEGDVARLSVNLDGVTEDANRHLNDCLIIGMFKFCQHVTDGEFKANKIAFAHSSPEDLTAYTSVFPCPLEYASICS